MIQRVPVQPAQRTTRHPPRKRKKLVLCRQEQGRRRARDRRSPPPVPQLTTDRFFHILCCIFNEHLVKPRSKIDYRSNMKLSNELRIEPICPFSGSFVQFPGFSSLFRTQSSLYRTGFFVSKSDFAACSPLPPATSGNPFCPLAFLHPRRSMASLVHSPITNLAPRRPELSTRRAARTEALYQYDLQKPQTCCINLLRSNRCRLLPMFRSPKC